VSGLKPQNSNFRLHTSNLIKAVLEVAETPDLGNQLNVFEFFNVYAHFALLVRGSKFPFHKLGVMGIDTGTIPIGYRTKSPQLLLPLPANNISH
jgi:hypothetical protein